MQQTEIYDIIHEKYDKLIGSIATKISGDKAISSWEDNYQDLWLSVYEAIEGFTKQNGGGNGPVESWIDGKYFGRYLKTCLWNRKNHKGKIISCRYNITRNAVPINDEILHLPSTSDLEFIDASNDFADFLVSLSSEESEVIACILDIPDKCISVKGKVKLSPIMVYLGWARPKTQRVVRGVKEKMNTRLRKSI